MVPLYNRPAIILVMLPQYLKLYNLKRQFIKKMKQNNSNNNFMIQTRSQKSKKYIGNMGEFLKSVQNELYLKSALGFNQD